MDADPETDLPRNLLMDRTRRDADQRVSDWWVGENRTRLYTHDNETLSELRSFQGWLDYYAMFPYALVALLGIIANGLVLVRMCTNRKLRTPSNYFITNLALTDFLVLVVLLSHRVVVTFFPVYYRIVIWMNASNYVQHADNWDSTDLTVPVKRVFEVCVQSTALVLAAMSYTRYHFIIHPLKARAEWSSSRVWAICGIAWIVSFIMYIPLWMGILNADNSAEKLVPIPTGRKVFFALRLLPMFVIPGFIILLSYGRIVAAFRSRDDFLQGRSMEADASLRKKSDSQGRKLTRMVVVIVLVFFLSWGPYQFYLSGLNLRPYILVRTPQRWRTIAVATAVLRLLAYCGCAINPFIYAYSNPAFLKLKKPEFFSSFRSTRTTSLSETPHNDSGSTRQSSKHVKNTGV